MLDFKGFIIYTTVLSVTTKQADQIAVDVTQELITTWQSGHKIIYYVVHSLTFLCHNHSKCYSPKAVWVRESPHTPIWKQTDSHSSLRPTTYTAPFKLSRSFISHSQLENIYDRRDPLTTTPFCRVLNWMPPLPESVSSCLRRRWNIRSDG